MIFYDFEVTRYNWLVVLIDPSEPNPYVIIDNPEQLKQIYEQYKNDIWIGYNSRHYDQYILKGNLCGFNAWDVNDFIVNKKCPGWSFSSLFRNVFLINYDVAPLNKSLKQLEGFQGHNIHESDVDFRIDRPLTNAEIREMVEYCTNDVKETMGVFAEFINEFNALLWLVKAFKFPISYMSKTKAQMSAEILECEKVERNDEWDVYTLDCLKLEKYKYAADWFLDKKNNDYTKKFSLLVAGIKHDFGWGGIHGAKEKYHCKCDKNHLMIHVDVESYYPRLMIWHNLLTRNANKPERFKEIFDQRMKLKREGKKKEQAPLKIVINGTYGISKDPTNKAYDPRNSNMVTINGQLLLLDLIEKLEAIPSFELIQSNTDGLIIKIHKNDFESVDDICYEWETRTDMKLAFDFIKEIYQKDVNNYIFIDYDGKAERKGAYVKELSPMDNDLPIVNKALVDYMTKGIPVEKTILDCDDLMMFQKICKLTSKFEKVYHTTFCDSGRPSVTKEYFNKCYRIFASTDSSDGTVYKVKEGRLYKFANTSENSFIENGDITEMKTPSKLDYQWYINLANERLRQYGVN